MMKPSLHFAPHLKIEAAFFDQPPRCRRNVSQIEIIVLSPITLDLSEFNVNIMTRNNGAHQRSPYGPGIQK